MATNNVTTEAAACQSPRTSPLSGAPNVSTYSAVERFENKLVQAEALAAILCGHGGEALREYNDKIQDNVLWLLSQLITEVREAHDEHRENSRVERTSR